MYIQTATQITQKHTKEIEMRKEELSKCEKREVLEIQEEINRNDLTKTLDDMRSYIAINDLKASESEQREYEKTNNLQIIEEMIKQCEKEEENIRNILAYNYNIDFDSNIYKPAEINMNMFNKIMEINKKNST